MRVLVVGASTQRVCGVRDCAHVLDAPLRAAGLDTTIAWVDDVRLLPRTIATEVERGDYDRILWHYSPFTYGSRGFPTRLLPVTRALARADIPVVVFLHELAPDFRGRGWRGAAQAAAQRAAQVPVLRVVAGALVTAEERVALLQRWWQPSRPVGFVPLTSHVPALAASTDSDGDLRVGVFGFRHSTLASDLVARSVAQLGDGARLVLVGAPGPEGPVADEWRDAAERHGAEIEFTGVLGLPELSHAITSLDVVVSPDPAGPAARRSTLAAVLAHGRPVLALDGPLSWERMRDEGAVVLAGEQEFPAALAGLVEDDARRRVVGVRARAFHDRWLAPRIVAEQIRDFVEAVGR
jgi:glycosyltransferase involved in cell wall biosynthesis